MDNEKTNELMTRIFDSLTDEQKEKVKACKTADELIALLGKEGIDLPDEALNAVSGGVQAGLITSGGSGEFGPKKQDEPKIKRPTWF